MGFLSRGIRATYDHAGAGRAEVMSTHATEATFIEESNQWILQEEPRTTVDATLGAARASTPQRAQFSIHSTS